MRVCSMMVKIEFERNCFYDVMVNTFAFDPLMQESHYRHRIHDTCCHLGNEIVYKNWNFDIQY